MNKSYLIVIPAYNESAIIAQSVLQLDHFLKTKHPEVDARIVVSDNGSTDGSHEILKELEITLNRFSYEVIDTKGKGLAIRHAWEKYADSHDWFVFMDADLATDLNALSNVFSTTDADVIVGDRFHKDSKTTRSLKRRIVSQAYRTCIRTLLNTNVSDFPCGFKAVNRDVVKEIVPRVENQSWFFDNELVYLAERAGKKIQQIPVRWEDPRPVHAKSKVSIITVAQQYLKEMRRLKKGK